MRLVITGKHFSYNQKNTNQAMQQKQFFLQRIRDSVNVYQFRPFWGLRVALAFLLLLLALSPSLQIGSSPMMVKGIAVLALALLGLICFVDTKRETFLAENVTAASLESVESTQPLLNTERKDDQVIAKKFRAFRIHSIVFEVNTLVEHQQLTRKTVELFVLPNTNGKHYASRAISRLKAAGYAIRPHLKPPTLEGLTGITTSLIGVHNECVYVLLGDK